MRARSNTGLIGIKASTFIFCLCFTLTAHAEYYLVYAQTIPASCEFCTPTPKVTRIKTIKHHHPVLHPIQQSQTAARLRTARTPAPLERIYTTAELKSKAKVVRAYRPSYEWDDYNLDLTTGDDNPYVDPELNIDR